MALVLYEQLPGRIGRITLNDPDNLNAMGEEMAGEIRELVRRLSSDAKQLRALIITGAGRAFSAGGNLTMLERKTELSPEENRLRMQMFYDSFLSLLSLGVPLIAAINGHAIGAGLCLASACDLRVCSEKAKLGFTFTKLGLHPGMGATYFLPKVIGYAAALELLLTGRVITAEEGRRLGLISLVCPEGLVASEAEKLAAEISLGGGEAVRQVLESMRSGPHPLKNALEREALCQSLNYASTEFREGVRAAIEKRPAKF